jgi:hypothetical protein
MNIIVAFPVDFTQIALFGEYNFYERSAVQCGLSGLKAAKAVSNLTDESMIAPYLPLVAPSQGPQSLFGNSYAVSLTSMRRIIAA